MTKTVLVTGTSTGIGREATRLFQTKGWNVLATMRAPESETELGQLANVRVRRLDVTNEASIADAVAHGIRDFGGIDVLVNNAGFGAYGPLETTSLATIRKQFDTNVIGLYAVTKAVLPHMRQRGRGTIVNISSVGGRLAFPLGSLYHGSKFAVEGLSEALFYELAALGIRVKLVEPGMTKSDFGTRSLVFSHDASITEYEPIVTNTMNAFAAISQDAAEAVDVARTIFDAATDGSARLLRHGQRLRPADRHASQRRRQRLPCAHAEDLRPLIHRGALAPRDQPIEAGCPRRRHQPHPVNPQDRKHRAMIKLALITGSSRGLGRSMALNVARHGGDVVVTYNGGKDAADAVVAEVVKLGRKAVALKLNVEDVASFRAFVESFKAAIATTFGSDKFDHLVHNAGYGEYGLIPDASSDAFDRMVNVHFKGPFFLTQALLPLLANGGRIINISTAFTRTSSPGWSVYAAAKGALEVLTRFQAIELGARGIAVNTVAPGAIETDFGNGALKNTPDLQNYFKSITALGRTGQPDDVGAMVASLLSEDNRWITGQRIEVSGGVSI